MHALFHLFATLAVIADVGGGKPGSAPSLLPMSTSAKAGSDTWQLVGVPFIDAMQVLVPAIIAIMALHKLLEGKESAGAFLLEMITKGAGAILIIQFIKLIASQA